MKDCNQSSKHHCHQNQCGGCEEGGAGGCCEKEQKSIQLNKAELTLLLDLAQFVYLPLCQFIKSNSRKDVLNFEALNAVYLNHFGDSLAVIEKRSEALISLGEKGLITLDYHIPLEGYDYKDYFNSTAYAAFKARVHQENRKTHDDPNHATEKIKIRLGSMAITELGIKAVNSIHLED